MTTENTVYELSGTITEHMVKKTKNTQKPYVMLRILTEEGHSKTLRAFQDKAVAMCMEYSEGEDITVKCKDVEKDGEDGTPFTMTNIMVVVKNGGSNPSTTATVPISPKQSTPKPRLVQQVGGTGQIDPNQMRIMRQSTLGYACVLHAPMVNDFATPELMMTKTIQLAGKLLEYVITGDMPLFEEREQTDPVQPEPEQEPEQELFPASEGEDDDSESLGTIS